MASAKVLIVDDDAAIRFAVGDFMATGGLEVAGADSCEAAERAFRDSPPDVVVCDYALPDGDALALLPRLKAIAPAVPVVVLTGHGSIDLAVRAIKEGAEQFLTKPIELPALLVIVQRLVEHRRARAKQLAAETQRRHVPLDPFVGGSSAIRALAQQARQILVSDSPVLLQGETGTGKGVLARWLHENGPRAREPFVDINCAGLARELLESELFGHERGAFTSAQTSKPGLLEVAHRGTVFLDEIGDLDPQIQPRLLKVLEERRFRRLGSVSDRSVDIRLISATHRDLANAVRERQFRGDLFFRISTLPLLVPSLRDRRDDIPDLARRLLEDVALDLGKRAMLSAEAVDALCAYSWPGNIRELRNVLERAVLLNHNGQLAPGDLRFQDAPTSPEDSSDLTLAEVERRHIERVLALAHGHVAHAAERLGIPKSSLYDKIKKQGITLRK